jgi:hypothetical protein
VHRALKGDERLLDGPAWPRHSIFRYFILLPCGEKRERTAAPGRGSNRADQRRPALHCLRFAGTGWPASLSTVPDPYAIKWRGRSLPIDRLSVTKLDRRHWVHDKLEGTMFDAALVVFFGIICVLTLLQRGY